MKTLVADNPSNALHWFKSIVSTLNWKKSQVITIKEFRVKRSLKQNALYWMVITCIADHIGDDKEEIHQAYKRKYLPWVEKDLPGHLSYWDVSGTPDQNTKEFTDYLDKIYRHAQEFLGIILPRPDDDSFNNFVEKYSRYSHI
jgi:hypothetical protein